MADWNTIIGNVLSGMGAGPSTPPAPSMGAAGLNPWSPQQTAPALQPGPYPGGQGANLPPNATFGGAGWPDMVAHKIGPGAPLPPSDPVRNVLQCMVDAAAGPFIVSSTSEPVINAKTGLNARSPTDPHYENPGKAFDITAMPPYRQAIIQAAAACGAPWSVNEYDKPVGTTQTPISIFS